MYADINLCWNEFLLTDNVSNYFLSPIKIIIKFDISRLNKTFVPNRQASFEQTSDYLVIWTGDSRPCVYTSSGKNADWFSRNAFIRWNGIASFVRGWSLIKTWLMYLLEFRNPGYQLQRVMTFSLFNMFKHFITPLCLLILKKWIKIHIFK